MEDDHDHRTRRAGHHDEVWQALDQFSEALRALDEEVRALAQVFERPHDRTRVVDEAPGRVRRSYD